MNIEDLKERRLRPLRDLVAVQWLPSKKTKFGILVPVTFYDFGLKLGKMYLCRVIAIGRKVTQLKVGDKVLIHEYGILAFPGSWKEGQIYFLEEENIKAKVAGLKAYIPGSPSESKAKAFEESL